MRHRAAPGENARPGSAAVAAARSAATPRHCCRSHRCLAARRKTTILRLALFDLDHTLLPIDSDHAWGAYTTALGWNDAPSFTARHDAFYAQYRAGTLDIHAYVRFATDAIRRQGAARADAAHAGFMRDVVRPALRPAALALVRAHRDAGDTTLVVTATNAFVTRPIAALFGVDELIAIELERDAAGEPTGAIAGVPSFREGKVARLDAWLAARGLGWSDVHSTFYSDSINDLALLERVDVPVATNPDESLRAIAGAGGWRILELFADDDEDEDTPSNP